MFLVVFRSTCNIPVRSCTKSVVDEERKKLSLLDTLQEHDNDKKCLHEFQICETEYTPINLETEDKDIVFEIQQKHIMRIWRTRNVFKKRQIV